MGERSSRRPGGAGGAVPAAVGPAGANPGFDAPAEAAEDGRTLRSSTLTRPERPPTRRSRPGPAPAVAADPVAGPAAPVGPAEVSAETALGAEAAPRSRPRLTVEGLCYLLLLTAAAVTRFWDLGSRALHHDESLHAYYSWLYATGGSYTHDPLMHGPFLFHANALVYLLFGDSDATSRYVPALFGTVLVGLPWLLRGPRHLGRWGALAASALFLISPSFLYYSRYIRHDLYTVVGAFLLFAAIVRYLEVPQRRWLVLAGGSLGFLFTNHEIVFAIVAVFAGFLWAALLWGRLRPILLLQVGWAAVTLAAVLTLQRLMDAGTIRHLPQIPWDRGGEEAPRPEGNQLAYWGDLLTHPLVLTLAVLLVAFVVLMRFVLAPHRDPDLIEEGWVPSLFAGAPRGSVERGVLHAWADRPGLLAAFGAGAVIFAALFTTMFTHPRGLATATVATDGTLLYWLGQQGVQRGEQPWFYFITETPQYELLALAFGLPALAVIGWRTVRALLDRRSDTPGEVNPRLQFQLFVATWFVLIFAGLSYAGEKMPWLIVHFTEPLILLAAGLIGEGAERWVAARRTSGARARPFLAPAEAWLAVGLLALGGGWLILAGRLSFPEFTRGDGSSAWTRGLRPGAIDDWWLLAVPPAAALVLLGAGWFARGGVRVGRAASVALLVGVLLLQIHAGWRTSFLEGDVAKDTLIYNTTTPDVTRMVREVGLLSEELTGGKALPIWYDACTSWPLNWYLRDFTERNYYGGTLSSPPPSDAAVVISHNGGECQVTANMEGYTAQDYVLRWHEPEQEIYRRFAIAPELPPSRSAWGAEENPHGPLDVAASVGDSLATQTTAEGQQRLWRLVMYREMPASTTNYGFTLYVRNDLVPLFNTIRY